MGKHRRLLNEVRVTYQSLSLAEDVRPDDSGAANEISALGLRSFGYDRISIIVFESQNRRAVPFRPLSRLSGLTRGRVIHNPINNSTMPIPSNATNPMASMRHQFEWEASKVGVAFNVCFCEATAVATFPEARMMGIFSLSSKRCAFTNFPGDLRPVTCVAAPLDANKRIVPQPQSLLALVGTDCGKVALCRITVGRGGEFALSLVWILAAMESLRYAPITRLSVGCSSAAAGMCVLASSSSTDRALLWTSTDASQRQAAKAILTPSRFAAPVAVVNDDLAFAAKAGSGVHVFSRARCEVATEALVEWLCVLPVSLEVGEDPGQAYFLVIGHADGGVAVAFSRDAEGAPTMAATTESNERARKTHRQEVPAANAAQRGTSEALSRYEFAASLWQPAKPDGVYQVAVAVAVTAKPIVVHLWNFNLVAPKK